MKIAGRALQSIWYEPDLDAVKIIDQTQLPHRFEIVSLSNLDAACHAIRAMQVRGAPLIGVTAAYGVYLAMREQPGELEAGLARLRATRPTAVNLQWALARCRRALAGVPQARRAAAALATARSMEQEDITVCAAIGEHGADLLAPRWQARRGRGDRFNILTHCNAGALATVDWGTALGVVYKLAERGVPVHVWVDETRPRNQGAALTCWELRQRDIPHTLVVDNAGGHLMQQGEVDVCLVGSDRTAANGDVCNKIGTYLKALAAHDNRVPFYVALPLSSIDFSLPEGGATPIEYRDVTEVTWMMGADSDGLITRVALAGPGTGAANPGFDVTPARLITGLITEHGVVAAEPEALEQLRGVGQTGSSVGADMF